MEGEAYEHTLSPVLERRAPDDAWPATIEDKETPRLSRGSRCSISAHGSDGRLRSSAARARMRRHGLRTCCHRQRHAAVMFSSDAVARAWTTICGPRPRPAQQRYVASRPMSSAGTCAGAPLPSGVGPGGAVNGGHRHRRVAGHRVGRIGDHPDRSCVAASVLSRVAAQPPSGTGTLRSA